MSNEVARYEERDAWIPVRQDIATLSEQLAMTPFVGAFRGHPENVFGAILYGHELHLAPLQSLQALDVIEGRPTLKSEALRALFFRDGHKLTVLQWDAKECRVRAERRDGLSSVEVAYTIGDAQTAGLTGKKNWRTSPKSMLYARATSMAIRAVAPDIALGIDMDDDVGDVVAPAGTPRVVQVTQQPDAPRVVAERLPEPAPVAAVEAEPVAEVGPEPDDLITPAQMRKIGALIGQLETIEGRKLDRDERRRMIGFMAGFDEPDQLKSAKDLTREQASEAIDQLQSALETVGAEDAPAGPE